MSEQIQTNGVADHMHKMGCGEEFVICSVNNIPTQTIVRVPGGWLHICNSIIEGKQKIAISSCFIPYSEEFKKKRTEIRGGQVSGPIGSGVG